MKLIKHFDAFLVNKVNLGDGRIKQLDERVTTITNFVQTGEGWIDEAYLEEDPEESKIKWRRLFGDKFGTYNTTIKKAPEAHLRGSKVSATPMRRSVIGGASRSASICATT